MSLKDKISDDIKTAMKARDKERTGVLRMLLSEIKYAQTSESGSGELSDDEVLKVTSTYAKRLRKSLEDFKGTDKYETVQSELVIIEEYLPKKASSEEISKYIDDLLSKTDDRNFGALMKQVLGHYAQAADGKVVSQLLKSKLN